MRRSKRASILPERFCLSPRAVAAPVITLKKILRNQSKITTSNVPALRPFPQFGKVAIHTQTMGTSAYHGLNLKFEKCRSHSLQFSTNYTWSKLLNELASRNESGGSGAFPNQHDCTQDRGLLGNNIENRLINANVSAGDFVIRKEGRPR